MKNILICVTGLTPQIVTEALYCLSVQRKIQIDEIYILTTQRGQEVIKGVDPAPHTPNVPLPKEITALCNMYDIKKPKFNNSDKFVKVTKEESIELADIRTDKDNIMFPNIASEFIKKLTADPKNTLYCVISGGRKTMSVHLANALSLFGRESDKLLHVLTSEENEFKGFYPKTKKEDRELELSELPFIRLRYLISSSLHTEEFKSKKYSEIVEFTQEKLKTLADNRVLLINTINREISFDKNKTKLEPLQFAIYFYFIEHKLEGGEPITIQDINTQQFSIQIKEIIDKYVPQYHYKDTNKPWWKKDFDPANFRSARSKINSTLSKIFNDENIFEQYCITSYKDYYQTPYGINAFEDKIKIIYKN